MLTSVISCYFNFALNFQVEFCYPPIDFKDPLADVKEGEIFIPRQWSALPYLAMPDGAHNYEDGWFVFAFNFSKNVFLSIFC